MCWNESFDLVVMLELTGPSPVFEVIFFFFFLMRFSPHTGIDYSFNLDDNEGACDIFDVQILNY